MSNIKEWLKQHNNKIRSDNDRFMGMSREDQRVQIALDVLAQIKAKRIKPKNGRYLTSKFRVSESTPVEVELQDVFKQMESCEACALGSLFLCTIDRFDKKQINLHDYQDYHDYDDDRDMCEELQTKERDQFDIRFDLGSNTNYLSTYFDHEQLANIEAAFEDKFVAYCSYARDYQAAYFFDKFEDYRENDNDLRNTSSLRLRLIMENIVVNNGRFNHNIKPRKCGEVYFTVGFNKARDNFLYKHK